MSASFSVLEENEVYRGWLLRVTRALFADPDGTTFERDVVHHPGAVAVVPVDEAGNVIMVKQFRAALGKELLEIPAGTCDVEGESLLETAKRELAEEVGMTARRIEKLTTVYNSPGYSDQVTTVYLATELEACDTRHLGPEEQWMTIHEIPLDSIDRSDYFAESFDAVTLLGLYRAAAVMAYRNRLAGNVVPSSTLG